MVKLVREVKGHQLMAEISFGNGAAFTHLKKDGVTQATIIFDDANEPRARRISEAALSGLTED